MFIRKEGSRHVRRLAKAISHPDVQQVLREILQGAQSILGNQFVGMYVHGSLAIGDFDPQRSDIDFLVVTSGDLKNMHMRYTSDNLGRLFRF
jgi:predicted nucleotidyltransferase